MRRIWSRAPISAQLIFLTATALMITSAAALLVVGGMVHGIIGHTTTAEDAQSLSVRLTLTLSISVILGIGIIMSAVRWLLLRPLNQLRRGMSRVTNGKLDPVNSTPMPSREWRDLHDTFDRMVQQLREARVAHEASQNVLAERTSTVDHLLEFSQTIQGAGQADQVFNTLSQFLESELKLAGVAILAYQAESIPPIAVKAVRPVVLLSGAQPVSELNGSMCPCLRQNLSKQFRPDGSPVRCAIDSCLSLPVAHPAYCIPFNVGRNLQVVVHMLLPIGQNWTEERRQLAQTYVNSAISSLISLHLLAEAEKQSMTDALTGLFNRRSMEHLLQREVALAERHGHPLSVVMIDMDKFKVINDVYGHAAGDHMLKSFAECVHMTLRKTDLAFRYGGDEFVIALPQTTIGQAEQVVNKLRQAYAAVDFSHAITRLEHQPTLSVGITERMPAAGIATLENLLTSADQALYAAKEANRNCVKRYTPPQAA